MMNIPRLVEQQKVDQLYRVAFMMNMRLTQLKDDSRISLSFGLVGLVIRDSF